MNKKEREAQDKAWRETKIKVKIIEIYPKEVSYNYGDDYETVYAVAHNTEWDEIEQKDLADLKQWIHILNLDKNNPTTIKLVYESKTISPPTALKDYIEFKNEQAETIKKKQKEDNKRKAEAAEKRKATQLEKTRKKLEKLEAELAKSTTD